MIVMLHSNISLGVYDQIYVKKIKIRSVIYEKRKGDKTERQRNGDCMALNVD